MSEAAAQPQEYHIPYPAPQVFGARSQPKSVTQIGQIAPYEYLYAEYPASGGILCHKKGLLFPTKGFPFPQAIQCVNVAKRLFIDTVHLLTDKMLFGLYFSLIFSTFKGKVRLLNRFISVYVRTTSLVVLQVAPEKHFLIPLTQQLWDLIESFLNEIGVEQENSLYFAWIFATSINYDNAYYLRLVDVFSEVNKESLLKNPVKEIRRVLKIYLEREIAPQLKPKAKAIVFLLRLLFLSKKIRNAFKKAVSSVDWSKMQYDYIDRYAVLERGDYKFLGLDYPDRFAMFYRMHGGRPPGQLQVV